MEIDRLRGHARVEISTQNLRAWKNTETDTYDTNQLDFVKEYINSMSLEKHVTSHMSPPYPHLLMARQDNTNN